MEFQDEVAVNHTICGDDSAWLIQGREWGDQSLHTAGGLNKVRSSYQNFISEADNKEGW